eukprot:Pgem_evm1s3079
MMRLFYSTFLSLAFMGALVNAAPMAKNEVAVQGIVETNLLATERNATLPEIETETELSTSDEVPNTSNKVPITQDSPVLIGAMVGLGAHLLSHGKNSKKTKIVSRHFHRSKPRQMQ